MLHPVNQRDGLKSRQKQILWDQNLNDTRGEEKRMHVPGRSETPSRQTSATQEEYLRREQRTNAAPKQICIGHPIFKDRKLPLRLVARGFLLLVLLLFRRRVIHSNTLVRHLVTRRQCNDYLRYRRRGKRIGLSRLGRPQCNR